MVINPLGNLLGFLSELDRRKAFCLMQGGDGEEKTRTATPAATQGADDVGNPNSVKMRALRPPGNVGARRILRREAACLRPGIASRPGGRKAAVHVVQ